MKHEYDGIEYHSDGVGREGHAAVNVKDHGRYTIPDNLEQYQQAAWELCAEVFWEDAAELAKECGYAGVYSEGRSDGWLVPYHSSAYNTRDLSLIRQWSYCPDVDEIGERSRFRAFQRRIEEMVSNIGASVRHECQFRADCEQEERETVASTALNIA